MPSRDADQVIVALREWLRNERRLGVPHWPAPAASGPPAAEKKPPTAHTLRGVASGHNEADGGASSLKRQAGLTPAQVTSETLAASRAGRGLYMPSLFAADPGLPPLCQEELAPDKAAAGLAALENDFVRSCKKCRLHASRTQTVFGVGHPRAELVFVGEGPGAEEDAQGLPFVGRAGQLLTKMIAAMTLTRDQVYICNVVKCRPPDNRTPTDDEMETCAPYLFRQLAIIRPKVIVALGRPAVQTLLGTKDPISKVRGRFRDFPPPALGPCALPAAKLMPTFHPAYLLRNPAAKGDAWRDLQQVMRVLGLRVRGRG